MAFGLRTYRVNVLGEGKNLQYLKDLLSEFPFCETLVGLLHPRFVMQYKLKKKSEHLAAYLRVLNEF